MRPRRVVAIAVLLSAGCGDEPVAAVRRVPANITTTTQPSPAAVVGGSAGAWTVRVTDADGDPIAGVPVRFAPSLGGGRVSADLDTTDSDGAAATTLTVGTVVGTNEIMASVAGLVPLKSSQVAGGAGPSQSVLMNLRIVRFSTTQDSVLLSAVPRDTFGNATGGAATFSTPNLGVANTRTTSPTSAWLRVVSRPATTWVRATAGAVYDSIAVHILAAGSSPCEGLATDTALAVGGAREYQGAAVACLRTATNAEYILVSHYNTTVSSSVASTSITGAGVGVAAPFPAGAAASLAQASTPVAAVGSDVAFERDLRKRERQIESRAAAARAWRRATLQSQPSIVAQPRVGDRFTANVNSTEFCAAPTTVEARVAAISDVAVIAEDVANPLGGFNDDEYRAIARTIDTLVYPLDTAAFGAPSDIDRNGRVVVLFTRAVNALTPRNANGIVQGFFVSRDLLPRQSPFGSCPGSNAGEMFYLLVPDPAGEISAARTKAYVEGIVPSVIAHELQHLINASRRLFENEAYDVSEEAWLNEGLSHIAEELLFYRASGRAPRQNLGAAALSDPATRAAYDLHQVANFRRYLEYLRLPDSYSPVAETDQLQTRGAAWAFLRFVADRAGPTDGDFWRRLVNARTVGASNLDAVLAGTGMTVASALRDWGLAVAFDDLIPMPPERSQASWNFLSAFGQVGLTDWLAPAALGNGTALQPGVRGGSSAYARFAAPAGQDVLLQASGPGGLPIRGMRFTIVRIK